MSSADMLLIPVLIILTGLTVYLRLTLTSPTAVEYTASQLTVEHRYRIPSGLSREVVNNTDDLSHMFNLHVQSLLKPPVQWDQLRSIKRPVLTMAEFVHI